MRIAAFTGTRRSLALQVDGAEARLDVVDGLLRGVAHDEPACRLILAGPAPSMAALALQLGGQIPLTVPRAGLAARAIARAADAEPPPRQLGAPEIPPGLTVGDALALVIGHLTDVILHWAAVIPAMQAGPRDAEPVHQMRVAVRRLRSALAVFRRAGGEGARDGFVELGRALKDLAATLGAARDWDVFLGATGVELSAAFVGDKRNSFLDPIEGNDPNNAVAARFEVEVRRLDDMIADLGDLSRTFIKIDTQGFDLQILQGGREVFAAVPLVQTEISFRPIYKDSPTWSQSMQAFQDAGFMFADMFQINGPAAGAAWEADLLMIKPDFA